MCDYNEYCIVAPEHRVFVPMTRLSPEQNKLRLVFEAHHTSWEFNIHYHYNGTHVDCICIQNFHGLLNPTDVNVNDPMAEIVIWRWNGYNQEIIKKELFKRNENKDSIYPIQKDLTGIHFTIRLIGKRKLAKDLCRPLDFLPSSDAFTISVGDQNFVVSAHRLMQISPVFRKMLTDEMIEKAERKMEMKDAEPEHFRALLEVIDPDQNVQPNPINVIEVLKLADRYEVNFAKDLCEMHLVNCVEKPLIERLRLVDSYGLNKLKNFILSIGSVNLRAFYLANSKELQEEGRFSKKLLDELILRLCR